MKAELHIAGRAVGAGQPCFVIAEISANHRGSLEGALELISAAKNCGADAVKLQTYTADTITLDSDHGCFLIGEGTIWSGRRLHDLYREAHTPWEWHPRLFEAAKEAGLICFSSPFDETAVDFLESLGCPAYKIASFELVDIPLIRKAAATGKPLVISTGMASLEEVAEAVKAAEEGGASGTALLKCTSAYPAPPGEMNLRAIPLLAESFGLPVGLSDHTLGSTAAVAAVALGACLIEKHLTLRRSDGGADAAFSLEPGEFKSMVQSVRTAEAALGDGCFGPSASDAASMRFRRSLFVMEDIEKGSVLTHRNVRSIRPADGLHPRYLPDVLGRTAARPLKRGQPLSMEDLA